MTSDLPMRVFLAEVRERWALTPGMIRIVFGGAGLAEFESTGVGDEYLRLFFPPEGAETPVLPVITDTSWTYPEGVEPGPVRTYTVREFRRGRREVVIDFVVHDGGVAAEWAKQAEIGDVLGMNTPTGLYDPPAGLSWQLLLADATGMPAVARIAEQTPPTVQTRVILEVASRAEELSIADTGGLDVRWIHGGNGHGPSRIDAIIREMTFPPGDGYIWVAGETATLRAVRKYLRHELKLPASAYKTVGYWNGQAAMWNDRFSSLDAETKQWLWAAWRADASDEEREDEYVRRLETLGL